MIGLTFCKFCSTLQLTVGAIQAKSVKSVCLKNLMDVCAGGVGYFLFGYAFAYGDPQTCDEAGTCTSAGNPFIGSKTFALHNLPETSYQIYYFQFVVSLSTLLYFGVPTDLLHAHTICTHLFIIANAHLVQSTFCTIYPHPFWSSSGCSPAHLSCLTERLVLSWQSLLISVLYWLCSDLCRLVFKNQSHKGQRT